jgi:phenylpropionate dioxygenase-like ring-hydroxylating dioxygenase large terminal subunit
VKAIDRRAGGAGLFAPNAWRLGAPSRSGEPGRPRAFANPDVFLPAWFAVARARGVRGTRPLTVDVGPRRLVLWRDGDGRARAFAAACPHMGASLGFGRVAGGQLQCALHHWCFDGDGACTVSPGTVPTAGRRAHSYPVVEKYGLVFVYPGLGTPPPFPPMPDGDDDRRYHTVVLPRARLRCHHHLATGNGLDAVHFTALHDIEPLAEARYEVDEQAFAVHLTLQGRYRGRLLRTLTGGSLHGRFSAFGPSVAWVTFLGPHRWHALFLTSPLPDGCESRAVLFIPRGGVLHTLRSVWFLLSLGRQDGQMLDALETFHPSFVDSDAPLAAYARLLESWPRQ